MKYTLRNYISGVGLMKRCESCHALKEGLLSAFPQSKLHMKRKIQTHYSFPDTKLLHTNDYERSLHESIILPTWDLVTAATDLPFAITEFLQVFRVCLVLTN